MYVIYRGGLPIGFKNPSDGRFLVVNPEALEWIPDELAETLKGDGRFEFIPDTDAKAIIKKAKSLGKAPAKYYEELKSKKNKKG